jgi:hypothetical protein
MRERASSAVRPSDPFRGLSVTPSASRGPSVGRDVDHFWLAVAAALVAISAWFGAAGLATGFLEFPDRLARRLPFGSTVVGGLALAFVIAVPYSALAVLALRGDRRTTLASVGCGLVMVAWIAVELSVVREVSFLQPFMALIGLAFVFANRRGPRPRRDAAHEGTRRQAGRTDP